jgi:hypothetical protein
MNRELEISCREVTVKYVKVLHYYLSGKSDEIHEKKLSSG